MSICIVILVLACLVLWIAYRSDDDPSVAAKLNPPPGGF